MTEEQIKQVYCVNCGMLVMVDCEICYNCQTPIDPEAKSPSLRTVVPPEPMVPPKPAVEVRSSFGQSVTAYKTKRKQPKRAKELPEDSNYGRDYVSLLDLPIPGTEEPQQDFEVWKEKSDSSYFECHFRDIEDHLLQAIYDWNDIIVGCIYTLTSDRVVDALVRNCPGVSIVIQKTDWLMRADSWFRPTLEFLADHGLPREIMPWPLDRMDGEPYVDDRPYVEGIRCLGYSAGIYTPKMHNKFLVFCHLEDGALVGKKVWTGSFNLTATAGKSFENAILIDDEDIATAYLNEYAQICTLSEPVVWKTSHPNPTWRLNRRLKAVKL